VRRDLEVPHRGAEARVQRLEAIPFVHAAYAVAARAQYGFDPVPAVADGSDAGHTGHDDPVHRTRPPFTPITCRVMQPRTSSDMRKSTAAATSSGCRPGSWGIYLQRFFRIEWLVVSVSISPGATQFTVMRRLASSAASALVAPSHRRWRRCN
jgi:hypothetical protein